MSLDVTLIIAKGTNHRRIIRNLKKPKLKETNEEEKHLINITTLSAVDDCPSQRYLLWYEIKIAIQIGSILHGEGSRIRKIGEAKLNGDFSRHDR